MPTFYLQLRILIWSILRYLSKVIQNSRQFPEWKAGSLVEVWQPYNQSSVILIVSMTPLQLLRKDKQQYLTGNYMDAVS